VYGRGVKTRKGREVCGLLKRETAVLNQEPGSKTKSYRTVVKDEGDLIKKTPTRGRRGVKTCTRHYDFRWAEWRWEPRMEWRDHLLKPKSSTTRVGEGSEKGDRKKEVREMFPSDRMKQRGAAHNQGEEIKTRIVQTGL